ncbi:hypothetical protein ACLOJK_018856, partial [Asimina triloba]
MMRMTCSTRSLYLLQASIHTLQINQKTIFSIFVRQPWQPNPSTPATAPITCRQQAKPHASRPIQQHVPPSSPSVQPPPRFMTPKPICIWPRSSQAPTSISRCTPEIPPSPHARTNYQIHHRLQQFLHRPIFPPDPAWPISITDLMPTSTAATLPADSHPSIKLHPQPMIITCESTTITPTVASTKIGSCLTFRERQQERKGSIHPRLEQSSDVKLQECRSCGRSSGQ